MVKKNCVRFSMLYRKGEEGRDGTGYDVTVIGVDSGAP